MSVWNEPSYRFEAAFVVSRYITYDTVNTQPFIDLLNHTVDPHPDFKDGPIAGNAIENIKIKLVEPSQFTHRIGNKLSLIFDAKFKTFKNVMSGLKGVYHLLPRLISKEFVFQDEHDYKMLDTFSKKLWECMQPSSYASKKSWVAIGNDYFNSNLVMDEHNRLINISSALRHTQVINNTKGHKARLKDAERSISTLPYVRLGKFLVSGKLKLYRYRALTILECEDCTYVFLSKDIERLVLMLNALARMELYFGFYHDYTYKGNESMYGLYKTFKNLIIQRMNSLTAYQCNLLCRALDVLQYKYLAYKAGDIQERAYNDQLDKIRNEKLDQIIDLDTLFSLVRNLPMLDALELLKVYKFLPAPDFCMFSVCQKQLDMYRNPHPYGIGTVRSGTLEDFWEYVRWNKLRTFYQAHNFLPGSPLVDEKTDLKTKDLKWLRGYSTCQPKDIPRSQIFRIDFQGAFMYNEREEDILELIKDKTLCPDMMRKGIDSQTLEEIPAFKRNQLLNFFMSPDKIQLSVLREALNNGSIPRHILLALKAEAKKA
jgi:hypothetical protein